MTNVKVKHR